jgi:hypothetical protein
MQELKTEREGGRGERERETEKMTYIVLLSVIT